MRYISRGRIELAGKCPRKYYYTYHWGGGYGWEDRGNNIDIAIGIGVHEGLATLLTERDVEIATVSGVGAFNEITADFETKDNTELRFQVEEGRALVEGLVRAWSLARATDFHTRYEIVSVEQEVLAPISADLSLFGKADIVVRDRESGLVYDWNHKTTQEKKNWTRKWTHDIQMWTEALVLEEVLGERIAGCIVEGLFKGVRRDGVLSSPLIYAFRKEGVLSPSYKAGWRKSAVWRLEEITLKQWVENLPHDILSEQFVRSMPILKNNAVVEEWLRARTRWENNTRHILESADEDDRLDYFIQNFSSFNCGGCAFRDVCEKRATMQDLVAAGRLKPRESPLNRLSETLL